MMFNVSLMSLILLSAPGFSMPSNKDPYIQVKAKGEIRELALDLDRDGKFDYYDITWGPLSIKKTFKSAFAGSSFAPSLDISYNFGEKTFHANYSCNDIRCKLEGAYYSGPTVFRLQEVTSPIDASPVDPMSDSGHVASSCNLAARNSGVENRAILTEATSQLTAAIVFDSSCSINVLGEEFKNSINRLKVGFLRFANSVKIAQENPGENCLNNNPDKVAIGKIMNAKLGEIQSGNLPFKVNCVLDPTGHRPPEVTENPMVMTVPIPSIKDSCKLNFAPIFAHEFSHVCGGKAEATAREMQQCYGGSLTEQIGACGMLPKVFDTVPDILTEELRKVPVDIPKNSLIAAEPVNLDRGINNPTKEPSRQIIDQAFGVIGEAINGSPGQPFARAANLSSFDFPSGNIGSLSSPDKPYVRSPASNALTNYLANRNQQSDRPNPTSSARPTSSGRTDRGLLASNDRIDMSGQRLSPQPTQATKELTVAKPQGPNSALPDKGDGITTIKQDRSPASSDPSKPTVASPQSAPQQQKAAAVAVAAEIPNPGTVAKPVSKISQPQGGNSIGSDLRTQGSLVSNQGQGIQKMGGDRSAETSNPQVSQVLKEIREKLGKNTNPDSLKDLLQKSEPILESNSIRIGFRSPGDKFTFLGARKDTAKRVYHILDGKLIEIQRK
jgi:hypothetical protein